MCFPVLPQNNIRWMGGTKKGQGTKPSKTRKTRLQVLGMSWFDQDDVFGFTPED